MALGRLDHFEILRFLGHGGICDVYLARDTHLDCDVALKVLRPDHAGDAAHRSRLLGEARALARVDHPNIVGILDCGEAAPDPPDFLWPDAPGTHPARVVYLAMRYVEGRDLSAAVAGQRLTLEWALDAAKQIARGLEAAHARGVVHRDLKPANVRVTPDGVLKIVDFGLAASPGHAARSMDPTRSPTREIVIGTVGYSAPEQGNVANHTDPRCDLFSLGVIVYEMVTGRPPFEGDTVLEVLREIATHEPPPMGRYARDVPDELERIVGKLLQKDPRRRYQSAHEVLTDLESLGARSEGRRRRRLARVVLGVALAATVGLAAWVAVRRGVPETVAIVPFENLTGDPALDHVAAGLGVDLQITLARACRINVVGSTLRDANGAPERDPARVAREYGARAVMLGTLSTLEGPRESRLLSLQLRAVRPDNSMRWGDRRDEPQGTLGRLRRWMIETVIRRWPRVREAIAGPIEEPPGLPPAAEEALLRGLALLADSDPMARDSSIAEFDRALALDPAFGRARAGRARARLGAFLRDRDTTHLAAAELDARAAAGDPRAQAEGRLALARVLVQRGRAAEAIAELKAVLALNDRNADAHLQLGNAYRRLGDMAGARKYLRSAVDLQPASPRAWRAYGIFLLLGDSDFAGAEDAFRREIRLNPGENRGYEDLAAAFVQQCRYAEAVATYAKLPRPDARSLDLFGNRGTALYFSGRLDLALRDFLAAVGAAPEDGDWRVNLGDCYARLGRAEDAAREYRLAARYFERDLVADPEDAARRAHLAMVLAKAGDTARARAEAARCVAANPWGDAQVVHRLAKALAIGGERESALAALDTLVRRRGFPTCLLRVEDEFAGLRGEPRFDALVGAR